MQDNVIKSIYNVGFWSKVSDFLYYTLHFTKDKILWEISDTLPLPLFPTPSDIRESIAEEQMPPEKRMGSFEIEYWQIENVEIKKGKFKITFMREYPLFKKKHTFHFDKKDQYDVESIFMKVLPGKTIIMSAGEGI